MDGARKLATYEDLLALPEDVRAEVLAGEIVTAPSALPRHARVAGTLARFIGGPFDIDDDGPGGWWILAEVDVRFSPHDIVRPDVVGWRRERLPEPWETRPIDVTPDWICEILSPSNAGLDRVRKRDLYARHRVPFYWLVDPAERTLEAMRLEGEAWLVVASFEDGAVARIPPFEAIELEVSRLFAPRPAK